MVEQTVIETENVVKEMSLAEKIEKGKWHKVLLHRNAGGVDFMGNVIIPNYVQSADYFLQYDVPTWVPDYAINILKESRRRETSYDYAIINNRPQMVPSANDMICHPFTIEETVVGVPDVVIKARKKGF